MVRSIWREHGEFEVGEGDFLNFYYEVSYKGAPYAYVHTQLIVDHKIGYCHVYIKRFTAEIAKEIERDGAIIKENMREFGINKVVGTKVGGIKVWKKFLKLVGFEAENIAPSIIENKPCMLATMEI